jgi:cation:H+ antiporter
MLPLAIHGVILAVSLAVLAVASHFSIKSLEELIELTGLGEASAGFAILSVMTSTPEIMVAVFSILQGTIGITVGDILGSNVANIGLVIGIMAIIGPLAACCTDLLGEMVDILFLSSLIPLLLVVFQVLSPLVGAALLAVFVFIVYKMSKGRSPALVDERKMATSRKVKKVVIAKLVVGIVVVIIAAQLAVSSAIYIANALGVPPILIGARVVAVGTSLPELALNIEAVRRGRPRLALGNAIGSNLTNLTLILGLVLLASPFAVDLTIFVEILPFLLITTLILWRFLTKGGVSKVGGILLLMSYILFQAIPYRL